MRRARPLGLALLTLLACSKSPSAIVVVVSTDAAVPAQIDRFDVVVTRSGQPRFERSYSLTDGSAALPGTLTLQNDTGHDTSDAMEIVVTSHGGKGVIERRATLGFVPDHQKLLRMPLHLACVDKTCDPGSTCDEGKCVAEAVDPSTLPDFTDNAGAIAAEQGGHGGVGGSGGAGGGGTSAGKAGSGGLGGASTGGTGGAAGNAGTGGTAGGGNAGKGGSAGGGNAGTSGNAGTGGTAGKGGGGNAGTGGTAGNAGGGNAGTGGTGGAAGSAGTGGCTPGGAVCVGTDLHLCDPWGTGFATIPCTGATTCNAAQRACVGANAIALGAGQWNFCALRTDGSPACWGDDSAIDGIGAAPTPFYVTPIGVAGLTGGVQLTVADSHRCLRRADGTMACWGYAFEGELGPNPGDVAEQTVTSVVDAAAVYQGTCALQQGGALSCWGANTQGQLGTGSMGTGSPNPTPITLGATVVAIEGGGFPCAILDGGSVVCWGNGLATPAPLPGVKGAVEVVSGSSLVVVRHADGTVTAASEPFGAAWGPLATVPGLSGKAAKISVGHELCVLQEDGSVWCGPPDGTGPLTLAAGLGPGSAVDVAAGEAYASAPAACVRTTGGDTRCWGRDEYAAMGNGMLEAQKAPAPTGQTNASTVAATRYGTCVVDGTGALVRWGDVPALSGVEVSVPTPVAGGGTTNTRCSLSEGVDRALVIQSDGSLVTWQNGVPALAQGVATQGTLFTDAYPGIFDVVLVDGVVKVYANQDISNDYGAFGGAAGPITQGTVATIPGLSSVLGIAAKPLSYVDGNGHYCAWDASQLLCWGVNGFGELGVGDDFVHTAPVSPVGLGAVTSACVGNGFTCAVSGGSVYCWGYNLGGQLGSAAGADSTMPVVVPGLTGMSGVTCGDSQACAWSSGGVVSCWGQNYYGELGIGSFALKTGPQPVTGLPPVSRVTGGFSHFCATTTMNEVWCWGSSVYGEAGVGTSGLYTVPTPVTGL